VAFLFYARLIALTAGTLVYLFLLALILGHRRPRLFERLLFFLVLSLLAIYGGGLLGINTQIQYASPPQATVWLYTGLMVLGTLLLEPFVLHAHLEYARTIQRARLGWLPWVLVSALYAIAFSEIAGLAVVSRHIGKSFGAVLVNYGNSHLLQDWAICSMLAVASQSLLTLGEKGRSAKALGIRLLSISCLLFAVLVVHIAYAAASPFLSDLLTTVVVGAAVLPGALLIYYALEHNFLDFGAQRNLVYALSATVLALLYLAFVHRISGWLAPVFPPEATASVLLFVLVFLFEPLERMIGPALHRTFRQRMDRWQRLAVELQEEARHGDVAQLVAGAERRIREEFSLAAVRVSVPRDPARPPLESPGGLGHVARIPLKKGSEELGFLEAATTGSYLTGETTAALEFLAEQLPATIDLCRLIEEKIRLERELAERERLALVGQMAAAVSHNLRNPLGAMKTVLQVQLENPDLPADVRHDCELVLGEIDRMGAKLTQLLHFAKPSVNGGRVSARAVAEQVAALFRQDAERRGVRLELEAPAADPSMQASEEALNEILSNLVVNAIEAQPDGGRVRVKLASNGKHLEILVEDDGPGISPEARAKIFQPFFTTKASGTGLGLAIVARRVSEMGGTIACESPLAGGKGTRVRLSLPIAEGTTWASDSSAVPRRADDLFRSG
jgi:signal transduction histidine kinase